MRHRIDGGMIGIARSLVVAFACALLPALAAPAMAQNALDGTALDLFAPSAPAPKQDFGLPPAPDTFALPVPYAPETNAAPLVPRGEELVLEGRLVADGPEIQDGITWRVFGSAPREDGELPLVATAEGGTASVELPPGTYLVHAAFGRAGAIKRIELGEARHIESVVFNAGGLKLDAVVGDGAPIHADRLTFEVSQDGEGGQSIVIVPNAKPGRIIRLAAGTYHVVSRYGAVNAVVRADIEVEPGRLTEATIRHVGAEVTLKLVSEAGGEALANTSWTVLTEGGDTVHESVGAFPSLILAEGQYTAIANHKGQPYARDFRVEPGIDRDVEVLLSDRLRPERHVE